MEVRILVEICGFNLIWDNYYGNDPLYAKCTYWCTNSKTKWDISYNIGDLELGEGDFVL